MNSLSVLQDEQTLRGLYREEELSAQVLRYTHLIDEFSRSEHAGDQAFLIRAPGRVNLIGEHTDYNDCPVLPMAVDRDIIGICTPRDDRKVVVTDTKAAFGSCEFTLDEPVPAHRPGHWGNYIQAAVQGLNDQQLEIRGFSLMIDSTIPSAAGLSSSSALVVLSALAALQAGGLQIEALRLAQLAAAAERYTGTAGGGMDQAAILLGETSRVLKIDFGPLRCSTVPFPEEYRILIAHSSISAEKTGSAMGAYNLRSLECSLAAALIGSHEVLQGRARCTLLGDLPSAYDPSVALKQTGYTKDELQRLLGELCEEAPLRAGLLSALKQSAEPSQGFSLLKRARHVLSERRRVEQAVRALQAGDMNSLGGLMYASHESCRDDMQISCPELDTLVEIGRDCGCIGCRLTGAGFGGCTVHLVHRDLLQDYRNQLSRRFYRDCMGITDPDRFLFTVIPSAGARILI
jgi:galactokinase